MVEVNFLALYFIERCRQSLHGTLNITFQNDL